MHMFDICLHRPEVIFFIHGTFEHLRQMYMHWYLWIWNCMLHCINHRYKL